MNVKQPGNELLAMDVARDDQELLVVTENGYGKRTMISEYPAKSRDTMGVKTITLTENKGALAGALVVREHQELVFISQNGMVQRTSVRGISRYGRASQGVKVMNIRDDDQVSAVALVVESQPDEVELITDPDAGEPGGGLGPDGVDLDEPGAENRPDDDDDAAADDLPEGLIAIEPDEDGQLGLGLDLDDESDDNEDE
jgi:DNA gyrase subunit A